MEIIDAHPHVFASPGGRYPYAPVGGEQSPWSRGIAVTGDDLMAVMAAAGVSKSVVIQTATVYGYDNSYLADTVARYPGKLAGVCSVNAVAPSACDDLTYWITERGLAGVRLFAAAAAAGEIFSLGDPALDAFWDCAGALQIPVDIQVRYAALPLVGKVARRHPELRLVLDHIGGAPVAGGPPYDAAASLFALAELDQVYVKFSGHNLDAADCGPSSAGAFLSALTRSFGPHRVLWGSNFPNTFGKLPPTADTYAALVRRALTAIAELGDDAQQALMSGTARSLYPAL